MHGGRDGRTSERARARGPSRYHGRAVISGIAVPTSGEPSRQTNRAAAINLDAAVPIQVPSAPTGPDRGQ
jgi:hypothetical protein